MGINSRAKGKKGELELSKILREFGYEARRSVQYCGANGDADVVGIPGIHIECKRVERLNLDEAMAQSERDAKKDGGTPVVIHRKNRKPWRVTMNLEDFIALLKEAGYEPGNQDT